MPSLFLAAGIVIVSTILSAAAVLHLPLHFIETKQAPTFGTTITTIQGTDTLSSSRSVINTNFSNLNTDLVALTATDALKLALTDWYATTSAKQLTTLASLATVGTITSGTWNGSVVAPTFGGTGWASIQANTVLIGNGTTRLATTTAGSNGQVLSLSGGVPTWVATSTAAAGLSTILATSTANLADLGLSASTTLAKFNVPANQLGTNGGVRIEIPVSDMQLNNNGDALYFEFAYGNATSSLNFTNAIAASIQDVGRVVFILTADNSTGAQTLDINAMFSPSGVSSTFRAVAGAVNTAITQDSTTVLPVMIVGKVVGAGNTFKPGSVIATYFK